MKQLLHYSLEFSIGRGSEGEVYSGINTVTNKSIAAKELRINGKQQHSEDIIKKVEDEYNLLKSVKSLNLVKIYDLVRTSNNLYIVYKRYPTDLQAFINTHKTIPEWTIRKWSLEILKGLVDLHFYDILHRDLKPSNILLSSEDFDAEAVITDFGVSTFCQQGFSNESAGTLGYMAPEALEGSSYNYKADIYSYGLILYNLCSGIPHDRASINEHGLVFRDDIQEDTRDFVKACLVEDPDSRPSAYSLSKHPFIQKQIDSMVNTYADIPVANAQSVMITREEFKEKFGNQDYVHANDKDERIELKVPPKNFLKPESPKFFQSQYFGDMHDELVPISESIEYVNSSGEEFNYFLERLEYYNQFLSFCEKLDIRNLDFFFFDYYGNDIEQTIEYVNSLEDAADEKHQEMCEKIEAGYQNSKKNPPKNILKRVFFTKLMTRIKDEMGSAASNRDYIKTIVEMARHYYPQCPKMDEIASDLNLK